MPRRVDPEDRRRYVVDVATGLVAERGVDALTVRQVAAAAGTSTAIVSYYFADKRDLLVSTYRAAADRSTTRFTTALAVPGNCLRACLESLLPLDAARRRDWRLWFAFWGAASSDPELGTEQRDRVRSARSRIEELVEHGRRAGSVDAGVDATRAARHLLVTVHGIGVQAVFDPTYWTARRQRDHLAREIEWAVGAGRPTP